jgi:hypothetical protein
MKQKFFPLIVGLVLIAGISAFGQENKVLSTKLQITVLNNLGNQVVGAKVSIYETEEDYLGDKNVVDTIRETDKKGRAVFKDLGKKAYFIFARDGSMDNADGNQTTDILKEGLKNKVTVIISD